MSEAALQDVPDVVTTADPELTTPEPNEPKEPATSEPHWKRTLRPVTKGTILNPLGNNGRNRLIEAKIRAGTSEGATIVRFFTELAQGRLVNDEGEIRKLGSSEQLRYMTRANEWLKDNGYGKAPLIIDVNHEEHHIHTATLVSTLSDDELTIWRQLVSKVLQRQRSAPALPAPASADASVCKSAGPAQVPEIIDE